LSSLGMAANFIHPVEGLHGDLGFIKSDDVALLFSYSGETIELLRLAQHLRRINCEAVAVTSDAQNSLARLASASILTGRVEEACRFGLAPSSSTTLMLAIGDALALSIAAVNGFSEEEFARNHPAGTIGLKLFRVESFMRSGDRLVCVRPTDTVRHVLEKVCSAKTGAAVLINEDGTLAGIFTDGDLRRALIRNRDAVELVVSSFATCPCHSIASDYTLADAHGIFSTTRTEDLPVVDRMNRKVVGMLCLKDISQL
jgi:arabinose-5-phosphate isomerase